jgi:hypothetical protein
MKQRIYDVTVRGELDVIWEEYLPPFSFLCAGRGETVFRAAFDDQSALIEALAHFQASNIEILSITKVRGETR